MIEFERIHHVSLAVRDLEKAKKFYSDLFHFQEIERPPFKSNGVWYAIGNQQLHLLEHPNGEALRMSGIDSVDGHFALWVKSYKTRYNGLNILAYLMKRDPKVWLDLHRSIS